MNPLKIAVFLPELHRSRMNLHLITPDTHGIELVVSNFGDDLSTFDGILHKFTYQLAEGQAKEVSKMLEYVKTRPDFIVIEPFDHFDIFLDRLTLQDYFEKHPLPKIIEYVNGEVITEEKKLEKINFPILIKPQVACGSSESHSIHVIHNQSQLDMVQLGKETLIAYPLIPHNGIVYKTYSLGKKTVMKASSSLVIHGDNKLTFDSQKPFPPELANENFTQSNSRIPSKEEIEQISQALQQITGIELLGYDIIRRESDGQLCLVDLNYFPAFRCIENSYEYLAEFIKEKAKIVRSNE